MAFNHMTTIMRRQWSDGFVKLFTLSLTQSSITTTAPSRWQAAFSEEDSLNLCSPVSDERNQAQALVSKGLQGLGLGWPSRGVLSKVLDDSWGVRSK